MKIVLVNAVYGIMSTGRTYMELQKFLQDRGHECIVVYGEQEGDYPGTIYMGSIFDHKCHALISRITGKAGCYSTLSTKKLICFLKEYQPEVVHLGNLHSNFINIPMLLRYLGENDIVTTLTLHDCYFYTGGCVHYTTKGCFQWKTGCRRCQFYREQRSWFFDRSRYLQQYRVRSFGEIPRLGVIGVSNWITEEAKQSPVFSKTKLITRIYNWVNVDAFVPCGDSAKKNLGISGKKMLLGVASVWGESKGLSDFIELAQKIGPGSRIVLVGKMPECVSLPENIISIPATNDLKELITYYSAADVFIQLSKEETFGKVVAEALACGTPAVVYRSTASPELVEDGCGFAVETDTGVEGILDAVMEVLAQPKKNYLGRCRSKALESFSREKCCQRYIESWSKLLSLK